MGSEMCIRDRDNLGVPSAFFGKAVSLSGDYAFIGAPGEDVGGNSCLLYTSDAADERSSVDLGGRRIIKKKIE